MTSSILHTAAALILLTQASTPPANSGQKLPPLCAVSGRVVTAAEGAALRSARVALILDRETEEPKVYAAVSDSDGRFMIKDVPAGRYHLVATHSGYVDQEYESHGGDTGAILSLRTGQDVKDVLFRLTLAAAISGRVNDEDGDPMVVVKVTALRRPSDEDLEDRDVTARQPSLRMVAITQTDDRGQYRLFGLKPGEYYIQAVDQYEPMNGVVLGHEWEIRRALGSQYASVYYPGVTQVGQAEAVTVTAGEETQADFIMRRIRTAQISGYVIGKDGKPATDATLFLEELPRPEFSAFYGINTDAKGQFKIKGVAPGSYVLHAEQHAFEDSGNRASQKVEVGTDNIDSVVLVLGRGVSFGGRVEISGMGVVQFDHLSISLNSEGDETTGAWAQVKKDGTFRLLDVSDGSFAFFLNGLEEGWYVKAVRLDGADILTKGLEVEKGNTGGDIQVVLSKGGAQLEGSVQEDDKPMVGARVRLIPDPETPYNRFRAQRTNTDQVGRFSFIGIAPGRYKVLAKSSVAEGIQAAISDPQIISLSDRERKRLQLTLAPSQTQ